MLKNDFTENVGDSVVIQLNETVSHSALEGNAK